MQFPWASAYNHPLKYPYQHGIMIYLIITLIVFALITVLALIFLLLHQNRLSQTITSLRQDQTLSFMQKEVQSLREQLTKQLGDATNIVASSQKSVHDRLDNAAKLMSQVQGQLGESREATKRIMELGQSIASLEQILRTPKLRGNLGELFLEELLKQILPTGYYEMQYRFTSGEAVDAVIRLANGLIPVDSKFPIEPFKRYLEIEDQAEQLKLKKEFIREVRKHINTIADKYILPSEGTFDFALMYIPAENIYYETIINDEQLGEERGILSYAQERHVFPVSPNSFYAYLMMIVFGLKGLKIEEDAKMIRKQLMGLNATIGRFDKEFGSLGRHISNATSSYDKTNKQFEIFQKKLEKIEGVSELIEGKEPAEIIALEEPEESPDKSIEKTAES